AGVCELVADGPVVVSARVIDLDGASAVRLECGEVSVELSPSEAVIHAPGGVSFSVAGRAAPSDGGSVPSSSSSLELEAPGGAIVLKLADHTATHGGRFVAVLRAGEAGGAYLDAQDALSGGAGVKVAPVDRFEIRGGMSAFKCRRVETQRTGGPKEVVRDMTPHERELLEDIARLKREIEDRERRLSDAIARRDAARAEYQAASRERVAAEERIKEDGTITLQLIGPVQAEGMSSGQLQKAIHDRYVPDYFQRLTVIVQTENRVFFVDGEVRRPDRYVYTGEMTVLRAVAAGGGFTDFAARGRVELTRPGKPPIIVDGDRAKRRPELDPPVYPGDRIFVPRKRITGG
ncbi:MAG TPA: SLBB domain-containing protein, partial [Verrucomicrobiota bacterium]|nr:SLBB domain-containing protein [Verrucomicrobiota bacterium]